MIKMPSPVTSATTSEWSRRSLWLAGFALLFWPFFLGLTAIETRWNLGWFGSSDFLLWLPILCVAFLCSLAAPFLNHWTATRKVIVSVILGTVFVVAYFGSVIVGTTFLQWAD
jgi:hypothetical protein